MIKYLTQIASLFYPELCIICEQHEPVFRNTFCHHCKIQLPFFDEVKLQSILQLRFSMYVTEHNYFNAILLYSKAGLVQDMIKDIKYNGKKDKALKLGEILGHRLGKFHFDVIIPIPLTSEKLKQRGYNQAEVIANGINKVCDIPIAKNAIVKNKPTHSQTTLTREQRQLNILKSFQLSEPLAENMKHVLVVDDIITTGATIGACTTLLKKSYPNVMVSYACIALSI